MIISRLSTRHFRSLPDRDWDFAPGFQVIRGANEAGKSSIVEALLVAIYGDATSSDTRYTKSQKWGSSERIALRLEMTLNGQRCLLERDFERRKNSITVGKRTATSKEKVRDLLNEILPLPTEESFLATACVRQDDIVHDLNSSDLRSLIELHSLSSTGQDLTQLQDSLRRFLDYLKRGIERPAPKNPGPIRAARTRLDELRTELNTLENLERDGSTALLDFERMTALVKSLEENVNLAEERIRFDQEFLDAEEKHGERISEVATLNSKLEREKLLPELIDKAVRELATTQGDLATAQQKVEAALKFVQKNEERLKIESERIRLANEIEKLTAINMALSSCKNPLEGTELRPEDFQQYRELRKEIDRYNGILQKHTTLVNQMKMEIQKSEKMLDTVNDQQSMLSAEVNLIADALVAASKNIALKEKLAATKQRLEEREKKLDRLKNLDGHVLALRSKMQDYQRVTTIDRKNVQNTLTAVETLENALKGEGIQFAIKPKRTLNAEIVIDGFNGEVASIADNLQLTGKREIIVDISGIAKLTLTNLSSTARQLNQSHKELAELLAITNLHTPDALLAQLTQYEGLKSDLTLSEADLSSQLEARSIKDWEREVDDFSRELRALTFEIEKLTPAEDVAALESQLGQKRLQYEEASKSAASAETRIQMLTTQIQETLAQSAATEKQTAELETQIQSIINRARKAEEADLNKLERKFLDFQTKVEASQREKGTILRGRLEEDLVSHFKDLEAAADQIKADCDSLVQYSVTPSEMSEIQNGVKWVSEKSRQLNEQVIQLRHEHCLLGAEQLQAKCQTAVAQAMVAEAKAKTMRPYSFGTPEERIKYRKDLEKMKADLRTHQTTLAEVKVRSDSVGRYTARIRELREEMATCEKQLSHLGDRLEIDSQVLGYLEMARKKALAELLAAIPSRIAARFELITGGRYKRVDGEGFDLKLWSDEKKATLEAEEMSGGTLDQFYLSLRLEALNATFPSHPPTVILDDALESCDPVRRKAILALLEEQSTRGQVVLLTCQDWPELDRYSSLTLS